MLGVNITPFNKNRPVIEDIKYIHGVPAKEVSLERLTDLLQDKTNEIKLLESYDPRPDAVTDKIVQLNKERKELLELTNELFPAKAKQSA